MDALTAAARASCTPLALGADPYPFGKACGSTGVIAPDSHDITSIAGVRPDLWRATPDDRSPGVPGRDVEGELKADEATEAAAEASSTTGRKMFGQPPKVG